MALVAYLLTAVLVVLKLVGTITIPWWLVFAPAILVIVVSLILVFAAVAAALWVNS